MNCLKKLLLSLVVLAPNLSSQQAYSMAKVPVKSSAEIAQQISKIMKQPPSEKGLKQILQYSFRSLDTDKNGITTEELMISRQLTRSRKRANFLYSQFAKDLDGDAVLTKAELQEAWFFEESGVQHSDVSQLKDYKKKGLKEYFERHLQLDANQDEVFDVQDFKALEPYEKDLRSDILHKFVEVLLENDPNYNETVTQSEAETILTRVYPHYSFGNAETKSSKRTSSGDKETAKKVAVKENKYAHCKIPQAPTGAKVIAYGTYGGLSLSNVSVAGKDKITRVANVNIEEGKEKLFLFFSSYKALIWNFTGAIERIEHVVFNAPNFYNPKGIQPIEVGASGLGKLKKGQITFMPSGECFNGFSLGREINKTKATLKIKAITGAKNINMLYDGKVGTVNFPSGKNEVTEAKFLGEGTRGLIVDSGSKISVIMNRSDGTQEPVNVVDEKGQLPLYGEIALDFPAGITKLDVNSVIAAGKPVAYDLLPGVAGLSQLILRGDIEQLGKRRHFAINKKIDFPPALSKYRGRFLLKKGVSEPEQKLKNSCLFSEEKSDYVWGNCTKK